MAATSYQLPDLLSIFRGFELRTNTHCWPISRASESWLLSLGASCLTANERRQIKETKGGLLAALCFPTCDAPQLRMIMDFVSLAMIEQGRMWTGKSVWEDKCPPGEGDDDWVKALQANILLRELIPSLQRLLRKAPSPSWNARFAASIQTFRLSEQGLQGNVSPGAGQAIRHYPDLEAYIDLRRSAGALELVFDLIEPLYDLRMPESYEDERMKKTARDGWALLKKLKQSAADIISWSVDIASHNYIQSLPTSPPTLISVIMSNKHLNLQPAMNHAAILVKQNLDVFLETERLIYAGPPPPPVADAGSSGKRHSKRWSWFNLGSSADSEPLDFTSLTSVNNAISKSASAATHQQRSWWSPEEDEEVRMYITAVKDLIAGSVHWLYENEVYFGDKAEEVKTYGWVFLKPKVSDVGDA